MKNLKIVQIGSAGHYEYALPALKKYGFDLSAIAPGCEGEFMRRALRDYDRLGYSPVIYDDWKEMIDKENPDVVIINSIMCYNAEMSIYALERGIIYDLVCIRLVCHLPLAVERHSLVEAMLVDAAEHGGSQGHRQKHGQESSHRSISFRIKVSGRAG